MKIESFETNTSEDMFINAGNLKIYEFGHPELFLRISFCKN